MCLRNTQAIVDKKFRHKKCPEWQHFLEFEAFDKYVPGSYSHQTVI